MAISIISTHISVVVRPADCQEPLDRGAHHKEDGAAHRDPEYKGGGEASYWDKLLTTEPIIFIVSMSRLCTNFHIRHNTIIYQTLYICGPRFELLVPKNVRISFFIHI